jgi:predicted nucleic acid-binding protein
MVKKPTVGERIIAALGGVTRTRYAASIREARADGFDDGKSYARIQAASKRRKESRFAPDDYNDDPANATLGLRAGGYGYRVGASGEREPGIGWDKNLQAAWDLKQSSGVVDRVGEIRRDYIVSSTIAPVAGNDELQSILDEFWRVNRLDIRLSDFVRQWSDYGAQMLTAYVRQADGRVKLGYIDPSAIERVITDPDNALERCAVVVKATSAADPWVASYGKRVYRCVRECESGIYAGRSVTAEQAQAGDSLDEWEYQMLESFGLAEYSGDCFLWVKNADSNQPLGRSDWLQVADTLDQLDSTVFQLGEREALANMIFADVGIDATDDAVQARASEIRSNPPAPGSVNVHGINETWNLNSPSLQQTASVETAKEQLALALGAVGIPVPWFGRGDETNRATAQAQGDPTWKTLQHDQGIVQAYVLDILDFVRDQAVIAGYYTPVDDAGETIDLPMPEMIARDTVAAVSALSALIGAMATALDAQLVTRDAALEAIGKLLGELGIEMDTAELKDAAINASQAGVIGEDILAGLANDWANVHPPVV